MDVVAQFQEISPTTLADLLGRDRVMDGGIRPLWAPMPRIVGPAFTVSCPAGDNLMLHAAIYRAEPGSVIVVDGGDPSYAVAGGNVCAVAQRRGIVGFIVDGAIRDLAEVRQMRFPVFARGVIPFPGAKEVAQPLGQPVRCGGVEIASGDIVVADEEGLVVVPREAREDVLRASREKLAREEGESLEQWEQAHRARIEAILSERGFTA